MQLQYKLYVSDKRCGRLELLSWASTYSSIQELNVQNLTSKIPCHVFCVIGCIFTGIRLVGVTSRSEVFNWRNLAGIQGRTQVHIRKA